MLTAQAAQAALRAVARPERVATTERFFKAYPGGYSEGDMFLACSVPATRQVAKRFYTLPLTALDTLIQSKWHDDRLMALIILVEQYKRADGTGQKAIYEFYMAHTANVNNWDLVDTSAGYIVGGYLDRQSDKMHALAKLANSQNVWERRIAVIATFAYIRQGRADEALAIITQVLHDTHDLIQKATGWMLREVGKRVDRATLLAFLDAHAHDMPRTTLRYAIEHLNPDQRAYYLGRKSVK